MGLFGKWFGKKSNPEDAIIANMEKMGKNLIEDMKNQFMAVIEAQKKELAKTQAQLTNLQKTMENEKPVIIVKANFYPVVRHGTLKRVSAKFTSNNPDFLINLIKSCGHVADQESGAVMVDKRFMPIPNNEIGRG